MTLRYVIASVWGGGGFPPEENSAREILLLRTANRAMVRQHEGHSDAFLFVFVGNYEEQETSKALKSFGFSNVHIAFYPCEDEESPNHPEWECIQEAASDEISAWLRTHHPGALPKFPKEYGELEFWWTGIEAEDFDDDEWGIPVSAFSQILPYSHSAKAETWLQILTEAVTDFGIYDNDMQRNHNAIIAATLCEWLHGFEAASGNGYNHFEASTAIDLLDIDKFYLGCRYSNISQSSDIDELLEEAEGDIERLPELALCALTEEARWELRSSLSDYFGGDSGLFWVLYSTIWPKLDRPVNEALCCTLDLSEIEYSELEQPWLFVTEGWTESADD